MNLVIEITSLLVRVNAKLQTKSDKSFRDLNNLFVKALLNLAQIFSAGLSSGEYGGKKIRTILFGTIRYFAL